MTSWGNITLFKMKKKTEENATKKEYEFIVVSPTSTC